MRKILEIKKYPEKILNSKCKPVKVVDDKIRKLLLDMLFTMRAVNGIGLAAPQVGINKQIAVIDIGDGPICLINPEIIKRDSKNAIEEGCLSLPEVNVKVKRSASVSIRALDENGKKITINADGLLAIAMQHELDHLNGILIMDHASFIKKNMFKKKLLKNKSTKPDTAKKDI